MTNLNASLAIVPAAGRSERFGGMKLLADVDGDPLLNRTLRSLLDAGLDRVVVVMAPGVSLPAVALLEDPRVTTVTNPDPARGMFSSIQAGWAELTGDPVVVLPADMPFVRSGTVADVLGACRQREVAIVAAHEGRRGHPLALPGRLRDAMLSADSRGTLKDALAAMAVVPAIVEVDDPGVVRDVDTKEDLESVRGFQGSKVRGLESE